MNTRPQQPPAVLTALPLSRKPDLKPLVSAWLLAEWPAWYGTGGAGNLRADVEAFAASEQHLPVGFVVFLDEAPVGFGSLKHDSIDTHRHLFPWAASGYVVPAHRGRGVGGFLLRALSAHALELGYEQVYCGTSTATRLLLREGWREVEQILHAGKPLTVFSSGR